MIKTPVVMSYARMLVRAVVFAPGAAPAGRAFVKLPPTYTVFPMTTCDQTTPSTWTVGSASLLTVAGSGAVGMVSALASGVTAIVNPVATARLEMSKLIERFESVLDIDKIIPP